MHFMTLLAQDQPNQAMVQHMVVAMMTIMPIIILVCLAIVILPFWFICKKAGFSPWLSLLNIIPMGGLVLMYVLAFGEWKVVPAPKTQWTPPQPPIA